jgi:type I restriction enzyme, S subunit
MKNWQTIKLKDVCQRITVGHVGSMASEYKDSGIPFLRSLNITPFRLSKRELKFIDKKFHDRLKKSALKPGDVAVVRTGYPGTACVIPKELGEANCSDLVLITPGSELNPHFLAAIFNSTFGKNLVGGNLVGAAQQHFNITTAKELKLLLPPKQIQDKIAAILTAYDDLIETNKRRIALLEKMAEEIYREWFVRLRFPGYQNTQFIKGIPEGWEVKKIRDIVNFQSGYSFKSETYCPDGRFGVVTIKNVHNGYFIDECSDRIEEIPSNMKQHCRLQNGEILLSLTGNVGRVCRVYGHDLLLNQRVAKLEPLYKNSQCYVYCFFRQSSVLKFCEMIATGAAQQNLSPIKLGDQKVLIPSCKLIQNFESQVSPLFEKSTLLLQTNKNLTKTRDLLLPRLISGKLPVEHLDIQTPPSMNP